jgi:hypothetical protein
VARDVLAQAIEFQAVALTDLSVPLSLLAGIRTLVLLEVVLHRQIGVNCHSCCVF